MLATFFYALDILISNNLFVHTQASGYVILEVLFLHDAASLIDILALGSFFIFGIAIWASFFFLVWNLYASKIHCMYDFLENDTVPLRWQNNQHGRWPMLLGEHALKKRFRSVS